MGGADLKDGQLVTTSFGDISYTKTGVYEYAISETGQSSDSNLVYSTARYSVVVTVEGSDDGKLVVSSEMTKLAGSVAEQVGEDKHTANFINTYTPVEQPKKDVLGTDENGSPTTSVNGQLVGVGDVLTYIVDWKNDAINDDGSAADAKVVVTDKAPEGTEYVDGSAKFVAAGELPEGYNVSVASDGTITWTIESASANASGQVSFQVKVTDAAASNDAIKNTAEIKIGDNSPKTSTETSNDFPKKTVQAPEGNVKVGDVLTYTVEWANTTGASAEIKVTDELTQGLAYVDGSQRVTVGEGDAAAKVAPDGFNANGQNLSWTFNAEPNTSGIVTFKAKVAEDALSVDKLTNKATIKVGDNSSVTNTTETPKPKSGTLTISKTVTADDGLNLEAAEDKTFEFALELTDAANAPLTGSYEFTGSYMVASPDGTFEEMTASDEAPGTIKSGDKLCLKHGQSITIKGLPEGANYEVTESALKGFAQVEPAGNAPAGGTITAGENATAAFKNKYSVEPGILEGATYLAGTKVVSGPWTGDKAGFGFTLRQVDENGEAFNDESVKLPESLTVTSDKGGNFSFGDISFTKEGTYYFEIAEATPDPIPTGWTYALDPVIIKVNVSDNGDGTLSVQKDQGAPAIEFTNTYSQTESEPWVPQVTKRVEGASADAGKFSFTLSAADDATRTAIANGAIQSAALSGKNASETVANKDAIDEGGTEDIAFTGMTFTTVSSEAGYKFIVTENHGEDDNPDKDGIQNSGWTMDTHTYTMTVKVTDENAKLVYEMTTDDDTASEFVNTYATGTATLDTDAAALFTKSFMGKAWGDERFGFEIEAQGDAPQPECTQTEVTKDSPDAPAATEADVPGDSELDPSMGAADANATKAFGFGKITFTDADMYGADGKRVMEKTFTYKVWENAGSDEGITYDGSVYMMDITVKDDGKGKLEAQTPLLYTVGHTADGKVIKTPVTIVNFSNLYEGAAPETTLRLAGTKQLKGTAGNDVALDGRTWSFTLEPANDETRHAIENGLVVLPEQLTVSNNSDGAFAFDKIVFKSAGEAATTEYAFTVTESGEVANVANDVSAVRTVVVKVSDDGQGNLAASVASIQKPGDNGEMVDADLTFINTYKIDKTISLAPSVEKILNGRAQKAGEFHFEMRTDPDPQVEGAAEPITVLTGTTASDAEAGASSSVVFDPESVTLGYADLNQAVTDGYATYDAAKKTWQLNYTISEVTDNLPGGVMPASDTSFKVTFQVTDNGDGTLSETGAPARVLFTNTYSASGSTVIEASKTLTGRPAEYGEFTFDVALQPAEDSQATEEQIVFSGVNAAADADQKAAVEFDTRGALSYDLASLAKAVDEGYAIEGADEAGHRTWTLNYQVCENTAKLPGGVWAGENSKQAFTVVVTDNGDGTLTAVPSQSTFDFVNDYRPTGGDFAGFAAAKYITGRNFTASDSFGFNVRVADGSAQNTPLPANVDPETGNVTFVPTEGADSGTIDFGSIEFTKGGTYKYIVTELGANGEPASGGTNEFGLTYDATTYEVTIQVDDLLTGTLVVNEPVYTVLGDEGTTPADSIAFTNSYSTPGTELDTDPTETEALFTKLFSGKTWGDESFGFTMTPQDGAPAPESTTAAVDAGSAAAPAGGDVDSSMGSDFANETKAFGFGTIRFTDADMADAAVQPDGSRNKTFTYLVSENIPEGSVEAADLPGYWTAPDGITYDGHTATLSVTVRDDGKGQLHVDAVNVDQGNFSNLAEAEPVATGGILVQKTLTGRDMEQGQFSFTLAATDELSADRLGIPTAGLSFSMPAAADGTPVQLDVTTLEELANRFAFTREDAGQTYSFTATENIPEGATAESGYTLDGYTYDATQYSVTFSVGVDEQGAMTVHAVATNATTGAAVLDQAVVEGEALPTIVLPFTNTYKAGGIITDGGEGAAKLEATKTLTGRPQLDGEFSFVVKDEAGNVVASASSTKADEGQPGSLRFSDIKYTLTHGELEGLGDVTYVTDGHTNAVSNSNGGYTFVYTVSELTGDASLPQGVTPDDPDASFTVVVTLTDNGDGTLAAQVAYPDGPVAFRNTYAGDTVAVATVSGTKIMKGLPEGTYLESGDYSFTMAPLTEGDSNAEATVTVAVSEDSTANEGTFSFPLTYTTDDLRGVEPVLGEDGVTQTRAKVFTYALSEINGGAFGVHYDDVRYIVEVTLVDHGDGTLSATVSNAWLENDQPVDPASGIVFTNVFDESAIQWTPQGFKTTNAADGVDLSGKTFGFVVVDGQGEVVSGGTSGANGAIEFSPITLPGEGTHYYTMYELQSGADGGITYDATTYTLELTVQPNGDGTYTYTPVYTNNQTGETPDQAYFTNQYDSVGAFVNLSATKTITAPHTAAGFRFVVVDGATDQQVATGTSKADGSVAFNTIFYSSGEKTVALPDVMNLTGEAAQAALAGVNLASAVTTGDAAPSAEQAGLVYRVVANGAELIAGTPVPTNASVELYVYGPYVEQTQASEPVAPSGDAVPGGEASDTETDAEPGAEVGTEPVEPATPAEPAEPSTEPSVESGAPAADDPSDAAEPSDATVGSEPETAALSEEAGEPVAAASTGLLAPSVAIADDHNVAPYVGEAPSVVAVSSTDLGDHWYTIYEINDAQDGVTYDKAVYRVRVTVADNGDGTMSAAVTKVERIDASGIVTDVTLEGANGMANVVFANEYKANHPTSATLEGTKTLTGRDAGDGEFTFAVTDAATGQVVAGGQSAAAKDGQSAPITFGTLNFSEPGEYDYVVSEAKAGQTIAGVTYDASTFAVHVSVVDNGDGTLTATVSYPNGPIAFKNAYKVVQGVDAELEGTKTLIGRDADEGEFGFTVTDEAGTVVATGQSGSASEGQPASIAFAKLHFGEPGEYVYTISEVNAGQTLAGITFDATQFRVKVVVTDNLDGTLSAEVEYLDGPIAFTNSYGATGGEGSTVVPQASKTLTGRDLRAGEFTFVLKDMASGEVVSTATNAADGAVTFPALRYEEVGEHEYTISEVAGREEGMTYDRSTFRLQVSVTDDGKGHLVATATYPDGQPSFANAYEKPEEPTPTPDPGNPDNPGTPDPGNPGTPGGGTTTPDIPKTGDPTGPLAAVSAVMGALVLGGAGVLVRRKTRVEK